LISPREKLDDIIRQQAIESGVNYQSPVRVKGIEQNGDHAIVRAQHLNRQVSYKAQIVILAIGANSSMLLRMGILKQAPLLILAARAYYDGLYGLSDYVQAHFENVPLPGYGWVFPISPSAANVGVGFWKPFFPWQKPPSSAANAMPAFLKNSKMQTMMNGAKQISPIKGYPLRIDFATAPTYSDRILLVGETAGLVSPLTGEGIDFALESGKLAANFLAGQFEHGDLSLRSLAGYDNLLRQHFQRLFVFLSRIRRLYVNPILMSRFIWATQRNPELKKVFTKIMLSEADAADIVNIATIRKVLIGI
jgi:flavin-dependent dehydrogenase